MTAKVQTPELPGKPAFTAGSVAMRRDDFAGSEKPWSVQDRKFCRVARPMRAAMIGG